MHPLTRIKKVPDAIATCGDRCWADLSMVIHPQFKTLSVVCEYGHFMSNGQWSHALQKWIDAEFANWMKHNADRLSTVRVEKRLKIGAYA